MTKLKHGDDKNSWQRVRTTYRFNLLWRGAVMKNPTVYILASQRNGTLYIGVTSDLIKRIWQHKEELVEGFTKQHKIKMLVWYEQHATMESAISKEKAMKKWRRQWKLSTIEERNSCWVDLWDEINK
jgi:putative endonuclease